MRHLIVAVLTAVALGACARTVLEIRDAPIGINAQQANVASIIETALQGRGWQVAARRPGEIDAFIEVRTHRAEVTIAYDVDSYSIRYRGSRDLNYRDGRIHSNYNRWVANLHRDIQRGLAAA